MGNRTAITVLAAMLATAGVGPAVAQDSPAGFYHITPGGIGAGYSHYFALFEDGSWEYGNQYGCPQDGAPNEETVPHRAGDWRSDGDHLVLSETERTVITGGTCVCDAIACTLEGGTERVLQPAWDIVVDPGAACASDYDPLEMLGIALPCLTIEGVGYFRLGPAEDLLP